MALITYPAGLRLDSFAFGGQVTYDMAETSDATGDTATRMFGPPRWTANLSSAINPITNASKWESFLLRMRGKVNTLAIYDIYCPAPRGTMRGAPFLSAGVAQGATTMTLSASGTLLTGDWVGVNTGLGSSQLVKVVADASSTVATPATATVRNSSAALVTIANSLSQTVSVTNVGTMTVTFEPPLRQAYLYTTPVVWDKPLAYFKSLNQQNASKYVPGLQAKTDYALDLLEVFA